MSVEFSVQDYVELSLKRCIHAAKIRYCDSDEHCQEIIKIMTIVFFASNPSLIDDVNASISSAAPMDMSKRKHGWKVRIGQACGAYCLGVFTALEWAEVFLQAKTPKIDCLTALANKDCFTKASGHAQIIARKNKKMSGFLWFAKLVSFKAVV